jgi:hypothetical protein
MENNTQTNTTTSDEAVTIREALKRLGANAPARQSFYSAVKKGRIQKTPDTPDTGDSKTLIYWGSVEAYIGAGGFKSREKSSSTTESKIKTVSPGTGKVVPVSPTDRVTTETGVPNPPPPESPLSLSSKNGENRSPGQTRTKSIRSQKPNHSDGRQKLAAQGTHATPKAQVKPTGNEKPKVRNSPPLRVIKNGLRHLDFEQTKAIRDWADNRLLTVLRRASPMEIADTNNENPQRA